MSDTFSNLINRTAQRLSLVYSSGVQSFAEDAIAEALQHKFDILFDEAFWPQYTFWYEWTLDGTLGVVTTDLTDIIRDIGDVNKIYLYNTTDEVLRLPNTINPYMVSGTSAKYYWSHPTPSRAIQFYPKAATGKVHVRARVKPAAFQLDDTVLFDDQALILGAAYDYAEDDGTNVAGTQKLQNLFESRVKQLKSGLLDSSIPLDPMTYNPQNNWQTI